MATNWLSISKALVVRWILTIHVILCTWRVVEVLNNKLYWLLLCGLVPLFFESCYTIIRRQGVEFSRFTPCFFFYLTAVLPGIWLMELQKTELYIEGRESQLAEAANSSNEDPLSFFKLSPMTWIIVIEEMLPYVLFISRWILPRGRVKREELAELLFAFIEIAADIMEFFSLFGEKVIRNNKTLAYCVLSIWSLSILQFTMTVTVIHQPKKEKKVKAVVMESTQEKEWERIKRECWAIFITILMQDLPFAGMRLYTIINFKYINYSLIFFTTKNLIIISLLLYKVAALCKRRYYSGPEDDLEKAETLKMHSDMGIAQKGHRPTGSSLESLDQVSISADTSDASINDPDPEGQRNRLDNGVNSTVRKGRHKTKVSNKKSPTHSGVTTTSSKPSTHKPESAEPTEIKTDDLNNSTELCIDVPQSPVIDLESEKSVQQNNLVTALSEKLSPSVEDTEKTAARDVNEQAKTICTIREP